MNQEITIVKEHKAISSQYRLLSLMAPTIAKDVKPGQFVHIKISSPYLLTLRRPFSIFDAKNKIISIVYKVVGDGTRIMSELKEGDKLDVIGPLGNGFPEIKKDIFPVLIAGGYGAAALYLVAKRAISKGIMFTGAASFKDLLCLKDFSKLGWKVVAATEDGSYGKRGLVTDSLQEWPGIAAKKSLFGKEPQFFVCGPIGMLKNVSAIAAQYHIKAWISMDKHMGCGIGVCLACVQKIKSSTSSSESPQWRWARVCKEGPVFSSEEIEWK
jgi:dihydroorotate dehydrogenase electron transfer subunit